MIQLLMLAVLRVGSFLTSDSLPPLEQSMVYSILSENQEIEILPSYEILYTKELRLDINSNEGLSHAYSSIFYDKLNEVISFQLEVVDPLSGKTIQKAKLKDMGDAALLSNVNIFDDNRYKYYEVKSARFPVQVIIRVQTKSKSNFQIREWVPVRHYNQKVIHSTLKVIYPKTLGLRYKEINLNGAKKQIDLGEKVEITWEEKDLPIQQPDLKKENDHKLILAPNQFALGEYVGKMESWEQLASWQFQVNDGRGDLPENFKKNILSLIGNTVDPYERIKILYDHLQDNFRYVSVQLGIGGWQTITADEVVKYSYGDCKGLTNLMKAMLAVAEIESNYTLVYAGEKADDIAVDLPSNQFNHVILQVPMPGGQSPIWLECTSNSLPAGYLGSFTRDRHVLVVKENGGYLTKTPSYNTFGWNTIKNSSEIIIDPGGNASIQTKMSTKGNFAQELQEVKLFLNEQEQKDYFHTNSALAGLIIKDFDLALEQQDSMLIANLAYEGVIQKFVQNTSKRSILKPFMGKITKEMLSNNSLYQIDGYRIELAESLLAENIQEDLKVISEGVEVIVKATQEGNLFTVSRSIKIELPDDYSDEDLNELLKKINVSANKTFYFSKTVSLHE